MRDAVGSARVATLIGDRTYLLRRWLGVILIASMLSGAVTFTAATHASPPAVLAVMLNYLASTPVAGDQSGAGNSAAGQSKSADRSAENSRVAIVTGLAMAVTFLVGAFVAMMYEIAATWWSSRASEAEQPLDRPIDKPDEGSRPAAKKTGWLPEPASQQRNAGNGLRDVTPVAQRLGQVSNANGAVRTLIVGADEHVDARPAAEFIARQLAKQTEFVLLIDWALRKQSAGVRPARADAPGLADLLVGKATFEDVISVLPGSRAHLIPSTGDACPQAANNPDVLNLILDSLDDAYDHVVITGPQEDCRALFEAVEGRFEACIAVTAPGRAMPELERIDGTRMFFGFDVTDIELFAVHHTSRTFREMV